MAGENANYNICMFYGQNKINQCICKAKHSIFNAIKLKLHHNMNRRKWVWYSLNCYFSSLKEFHVIEFLWWWFSVYFHLYIYIVFCSIFVFIYEVRFKFSCLRCTRDLLFVTFPCHNSFNILPSTIFDLTFHCNNTLLMATMLNMFAFGET